MFPLVCTPSFINRTRKAEFQRLAKKLQIETEYENSDGDEIELTKAALCLAINSHAEILNRVATRRARKTKRKVKNARAAPKKAAHKS